MNDDKDRRQAGTTAPQDEQKQANEQATAPGTDGKPRRSRRRGRYSRRSRMSNDKKDPGEQDRGKQDQGNKDQGNKDQGNKDQGKKGRGEQDRGKQDQGKQEHLDETESRPGADAETDAAPADRPRDDAWSLDDFQVAPAEGMTRFHDFDLPPEIMHAIHDLGFEYCTPIQEQVLQHVHSRRDLCGRAQTGTGKTAAFLIHIFTGFLERERTSQQRRPGVPRALILAPTRELVLQIIRDAEDLGKHCGFRSIAVYGGMDHKKQRRQLESGKVDLVAATPGRLLDFMGSRVIDLSAIDVLVLDEADRMLDMGFIPDVKRIIRRTTPKEKRCTYLFSATLDERVRRLAAQWMQPDPIQCEVEDEEVAAEHVQQIVYTTTADRKFAVLYNLLQQPEAKRVLIFCNRRSTTSKLNELLWRHDITCEELSGSVRQKKRLRILDDFRSGKLKVVVATDVAGRGLHVDDISHVINYEFPYEAEDYVHRIGRTGRAGREGISISFACEEESFVIPEIEAYIEDELRCERPPEELLEPPPKPTKKPRRSRDKGRGKRGPGRGKGGPGRGRPRGRGGRGRGPRRRR